MSAAPERPTTSARSMCGTPSGAASRYRAHSVPRRGPMSLLISELPMLRFRPLPWEYGVRNLLRRPARSGLTLACLTLVVLLVLVVVGFVRGLEASLGVSGDPR